LSKRVVVVSARTAFPNGGASASESEPEGQAVHMGAAPREPRERSERQSY